MAKMKFQKITFLNLLFSLLIVGIRILTAPPVYALEAELYRGNINTLTEEVNNLALRYPVVAIKDLRYIPLTEDFASALGISVRNSAPLYQSSNGKTWAFCPSVRITTVEPERLSEKAFGENADLKNPVPLVTTVYVNNQIMRSNFPVFLIDGVIYLCVDFTSDLPFDTSSLIKRRNDKEIKTLPSTFSSLERLQSYDFVRNQGSTQECWAYAANSLFEIKIASEEGKIHNFSEKHLIRHCPIPSDSMSGGNWKGSAAYFTKGLGPVEETTDDPTSSLYTLKEYREVSGTDDIKHAIYKNGAVLTSIYFGPGRREYYNPDHDAYYHDNHVHPPTHELVLIGWDDNYPKTSFKITPPEDGAFIAMNSFGKDFGNGGLFYISYCDTLATKKTVTIDSYKKRNVERLTISKDTGGVTNYETFIGKGNLYGAIKVNLTEKARIREIGVFSAGKGEVKAYYCKDFPTRRESLTYLGEVYFDTPGYKEMESYYNKMAEGEFYIVLNYLSRQRFTIPIEAPYPGMDYPVPWEEKTGFIGYKDGERLIMTPLEQIHPNAVIVMRLMVEPLQE